MSRDWLKLAKYCYASSTTYVDANYRKKWDDSIRMFQSRHPQDSKYNTEAYKHRSKIFRPKTRSLVRKHEAAVAAAFFSNQDVINATAVNEDDKEQAASASLMKEIIQYRLTKSIPWFKILCGGMQDAMTIGIVCSYQYWKYKSKPVKTSQPMLDAMGQPLIDHTGMPLMMEVMQNEVIEDKPCIELLPVENIRFDPGADWLDPVTSSPYFIRLIPMYSCDIKQLMDSGDEETGKKWKKYSDAQIRSAIKQDNDQTKQTREQNKQSTVDTGNAPLGEYEIAWVHENFVRIDGDEMVYFTLGTEFMLTDPVHIKDVYFHGDRPIVIGTCIIETHKAIPDSPVIIGEQLQREANEIVNQRLDNVKLVLNKRYIVKRGAQVDLKSIVRNVPASITLANDPAGDIREIEFNDVTASSYQEQDRLNVDYDELTGSFSQGSVMTNRKMGETVGGMGMISNAANQITEYTIRTFTETWVEPVLRQLVKLEQKYETDEVVFAVAAGKAKLLQKYGISQIHDSLLNKELTLNVNVGMGATDPIQKLNKFMGALSAYANVAQMNLPDMDMGEISKEIFGLAGYRDGARFSGNQEDDARIKQVIQKAQEFVQQSQAEIAQKGQELQGRETQLSLTEKDLQNEFIKLDAYKKEIGLIEKLAKQNLDGESYKLSVAKDINNVDAVQQENSALVELVNEIKSKLDEPEEPEEPKQITLVAPSGGVYRGIVNGQQISIEAPSGAVYSGTVQ